jgi:glycosyltransferase involved in cell wall biosynthesis
MLGCVALINPSNFEGWNTTVEEAKASDVPIILSNLDVHREQGSDRAFYFDPKSPEQLANILENYVAPNRLQEPALQALAAQRRMAFVTAFEDAVLEPIKQRLGYS